MAEGYFENKYAISTPSSQQTSAAPTNEPSGGGGGATQSNYFETKYSNSLPQGESDAGGGEGTISKALTKTGQTIMDQVEAFNYGFNKFYGGIVEGVARLSGATGPADRLKNDLNNDAKDYTAARERSPWATLGSAMNNELGVAALPIGGVAAGLTKKGITSAMPAISNSIGEVGSNILSNAVGGAAMGAAPMSDDRAANGAMGATFGAFGAAAGEEASSLMNDLANKPGVSNYITQLFAPKQSALKDLAYSVNARVKGDLSKIDEATAAADRLGIDNLSPAQALGGKSLRADEASQKANARQIPDVEAADESQVGGIKAQINSAVEGMAPEGTRATKESLYKELASKQLDGEAFDNLNSNPEIGDRLKLINKSGVDELRSLPDNSFLKLDAVKQSLDDKLFNDSYALDVNTKMEPNIRAGLEQTRDKLVSTLDQLDPTYAPARKEAQKLILRDKYEAMLKKVNDAPGDDLPEFDKIKSLLFGNAEKKELFLKNIAAAGGDVDKAKDIITVAGKLYQSPVAKIAKKATTPDLEKVAGGKGAYHTTFTDLTQKLIGGISAARYRAAMLKLTIGGHKNWSEEVKSVLAPKTMEGKVDALTKYIIGTGAVTNSRNNY